MSSPSYRLINPQANRSFVFKWEHFDLNTRWHYHPEIELIYFIEGSTSAVIGDGFQYFSEGELVILGSNFPHVLQENKEYVQQHPGSRPFGLILQFTTDFLGPDFMLKPELNGIRLMLDKAARGLYFKRAAAFRVKHLLVGMHQLSETRKLISLLDVLHTLSESDEYEYMTHSPYSFNQLHDEERMKCIYQYIFSNFREKISVKDIAAVANMTETSFCRYFKTRTLKNFTLFLNETRVAYACKLLSNTNYSITDVCFDSGFNELSYFTRQFKQIMKRSPQQFRKWKKEMQQA